jgi:hypothetical protein
MTSMLRHQGWTIERVVPLLGGSIVLTSLTLARRHSTRWRALTGFVGANLVLYGAVGWCPASLLMGRMGLPRLAATPTVDSS